MKKKNFRAKLDLACSKDELRPVLNYVYFTKGNAVATNAHILVKSPLNIHGFEEEEIKLLEGFCISGDQFKFILKFERVNVLQEGVLTCFSKCGSKIIVELKKMEEIGVYPDFEKVIPKDKQEVKEIGFDVKLLSLVKYLIVSDYSKNCRFMFNGASKGILITSTESEYDKQLILVMPIMLHS